MAKLLKKNLSLFLKSVFTKWLEDVLISIGIAVILITTYQTYGTVIGNYALGVFLLGFGFLIAKK